MKLLKQASSTTGALALLAFAACSTTGNAIRESDLTAKTVVLVHGAFADGSSWNKVVPHLQREGLRVIAVQNPLSSLEDDVAFTERAIKQADGPVVLVGHSWGGMVISQAGSHDKVQALVYVSAFAADAGETIHTLSASSEKVPGLSNPIVDGSGYISLSDEAVLNYFAPDIPVPDARLIAASQGKLNSQALDDPVTKAAWRDKPSWFVVSANDQMIHPNLMRRMAAKIGARTVELGTSHVPMLSRPVEVASVILAAARAN